MIFGFYYRFYRLTKNKYISTALAYGARFVYFMRYLLKKLFLKKETVVLDLAHAMKILEAASPDPMGRPGYDNGETEEDLDLSGYSVLREVEGLFQQVQLDESRTCVFWNEDVDLPSDILYEYGMEK